MSKRLLLAKSMQSFGVTRLLELYPAKPGILIINHHRIGDPQQTRFDRGVFSATTEQLDQQVRYIKRQFPIVVSDDLEELITAKKPLKRLYVAITFDDGYLDNYTNAFDVMRSNGCAGIFFLVPTYVGTNTIPWWDAVAYLVRNSPKKTITLELPVPLTVELEGDRECAIYRVLQHYKRPDNTTSDEFMGQLQAAADCELPEPGRRFLSWQEAREMQAAGMAIGSHTLTHRILGQLSQQEQEQELVHSRSILQEQLGRTISTLAYPVGSRTAFSETTEQLATSAGYKTCFSFYGGFNTPDSLQPMNLLRNSVEPDPLMFRSQMVFMSRFGKLPY